MDIQEPTDESWKARASEPEGSVQARTVGMTASGADRVVANKAQTYCPRLERLVPWVVKKRSCPDIYELINRYEKGIDRIQGPMQDPIRCPRWAICLTILSVCHGTQVSN
jgi:hypothetical protein